MKKIALIAAVAATVAAPAFAQSARIGAVQLLNLSHDTAAESITLNNVGAAANTGGSLGEAFRVLNRSADAATDLRGTNGATAVSGTPAYGADIFERLRAAALEDE
jgi:hypothetical protein